MALYDRAAHNGPGQWIDLSLYESVIRILDSLITRYDGLGDTPMRMGNRYLNVAPSDVFKTRDGRYVFHSSATQTVYERLMAAIGRSDLVGDERYATNTARTAPGNDINDIVQKWFAEHDLSDALRVLEENDVPCSAVNTMAEVAVDPQLLERESLIRRSFASVGDILMPGVIPKLSETPGDVRHAGPAIGQHTTEVLTELLEMSDGEIEDFSKRGIV